MIQTIKVSLKRARYATTFTQRPVSYGNEAALLLRLSFFFFFVHSLFMHESPLFLYQSQQLATLSSSNSREAIVLKSASAANEDFFSQPALHRRALV